MVFIRRALSFIRIRTWWIFIQAATKLTSNKAMPRGAFEIVRDTGLFPSHPQDSQASFLIRWNEAVSKLVLGRYEEGTALAKEMLTDVYKSNGVDPGDSEYFPPHFGWNFSSNIGHVGWLYGHVIAQKVGLVPKGTRNLLLMNSQLENVFLQNVHKTIRLVPSNLSARFGELPYTWHLFERLSMIKTTEGFVSDYELMSSVLSEQYSNEVISLEDDYLDRAVAALQDLGLPKNVWFVCLHVRNGRNSEDLRSQEIQTYSLAVDEVIRRGGYVIRIGDDSMPGLEPRKGLIDLTQIKGARTWLHPAVIAKSRLFLGTTSGPSFIAPFLGTPCLVTNLTSIGRNAISGRINTSYLPKLVTRINGPNLSLFETLSSPAGYGELGRSELRRMGLALVENTSTQILQATIAALEDQEPGDLLSQVNLIRSQHTGFVSPGRFSSAVLLEEPNWLS